MQAEQDQQQAQADQAVPAQVRPIVSLEKGDLEFWMQVVAIILLFLIYRELARSNGREAMRGIANGVIQ